MVTTLVNDEKDRERKEIIDFWMSFFPEIDKLEDLDRIIELILGIDISCAVDMRIAEEEDAASWIDMFFEDDIEKRQQASTLEKIVEKIQREIQWAYFFEPIVKKYVLKTIGCINRQYFIKDSKEFIYNVLLNLYRKLVNMTFRTLVMETNIASEEGRLDGDNDIQRSYYYCKVLLKDKKYLSEIYHVYPELIRCLDLCTRNTLGYVEEIIGNLEKEILHFSEFGKLISIHMGQGDTHNGGKSVVRLHFEHGTIYYKPRSLAMENKYSELQKWIKMNNPNYIGIDTCQAWDYDKFGITERIDNIECKSENDISAYYYKIGELLCLLYTLNSKDFHCENIIAKKDSPILIDLETLLHTSVEGKEEDNLVFFISKKIQESVIGTSLLPTLLPNEQTEEAIEVGGIGTGKKQRSPFKTQIIEQMNSDEINIKFVNKELPPALNYPKYKGQIVGCSEYLSIIREGFSHLYTWICENKDSYWAEVQLLFGNMNCRAICKNTNIYTQLLETGYHPDLLHNSWDRKIYFCRLGLLLLEKEDAYALKVYKSEYEDLMNGDIPIFYIRANDNKVYNWTDKIVLEEKETVMDLIKEKIYHMGTRDLKHQIALINLSFVGSKIKTDLPNGTKLKFGKQYIVKQDRLTYAEKIANLLAEGAIEYKTFDKKQISWMGMRGFGDGFYRITPIGFSIYQGNAGIAIFFYELYKKTKREKYGKIAESIISPVLEHMEMELENNNPTEGIGAFTGLSSEVYTLVFLEKKYTFKQEFILRGQKLFERYISFIRKSIKRKDEYGTDFLSGLAGVLGVLVSMIDIANEALRDEIKKAMREISDEILNRVIEKKNYKTWSENGDIGYAHGNIGIMVQLIRSYQYVRNNQIILTVRDVLAYERKKGYDSTLNIWKLRNGVHYFSWCNGIGGLILGKILLYKNKIEEGKMLLDEIKELVRQLKEKGFGTDFSVCHGDIGSLNILKYAGDFLGDRELIELCNNFENHFIEDYLKKYLDMFEYTENWGLMTGLAGIGMSLCSNENELIDLLYLN